ncbi:DUF2235 domain-containing protein [Citrobacter sp. MNAZ 1397]|uniref:DUF2235 domain-containing protein n=1 Tax=Citrobacter sp. MNAZ 1397 TaxID=2911205 RepID=UPI00202737BC|nr:DUF2235 domain-containing protein [Citrobacter sp. MNAZ 1397]MCL9670581.1 DUF2235 domain-containing protein [Citrobacter sp. MNAZ 1397]
MHLIVFCDGTWNTPDQMDNGIPAPTNVVKLRNALAVTPEQQVYYHPGVGTDGGWWNRVVGGGTGEGLDNNIMSAYNWLARHYQPNAAIWLFGFSRGAYTVRSLSGMIARCGLLNPAGLSERDIWSAVSDIFAHYRDPTTKVPAWPVYEGGVDLPIHFIGVWDTVGALGVPDDMVILNLIDNPDNYRFHNTALSHNILHARHAMAIDEKRQSFIPTLWTDIPAGADVIQLWFPGVHSDIGGGYSRCGLADGALEWMIKEAQALGLQFRDDVLQQIKPDAFDQLHDSVTGVFASLKTRPRNVPCFELPASPFHPSAMTRHTCPSLVQGIYWPGMILKIPGDKATLKVYAREHWNATGIYLEGGVTYSLSASGEWKDSSIICGPQGNNDGKFQPGEAVQMAASLLGKAEVLYQKLTHNHQADFWYTRREEDAPWFALMGMVANDVLPETPPKNATNFLPHEVFRIGSGCTFTPQKSGYLYAFANDAWQMYANNNGSVELTVTRTSF